MKKNYFLNNDIKKLLLNNDIKKLLLNNDIKKYLNKKLLIIGKKKK